MANVTGVSQLLETVGVAAAQSTPNGAPSANFATVLEQTSGQTGTPIVLPEDRAADPQTQEGLPLPTGRAKAVEIATVRQEIRFGQPAAVGRAGTVIAASSRRSDLQGQLGTVGFASADAAGDHARLPGADTASAGIATPPSLSAPAAALSSHSAVADVAADLKAGGVEEAAAPGRPTLAFASLSGAAAPRGSEPKKSAAGTATVDAKSTKAASKDAASTAQGTVPPAVAGPPPASPALQAILASPVLLPSTFVERPAVTPSPSTGTGASSVVGNVVGTVPGNDRAANAAVDHALTGSGTVLRALAAEQLGGVKSGPVELNEPAAPSAGQQGAQAGQIATKILPAVAAGSQLPPSGSIDRNPPEPAVNLAPETPGAAASARPDAPAAHGAAPPEQAMSVHRASTPAGGEPRSLAAPVAATTVPSAEAARTSMPSPGPEKPSAPAAQLSGAGVAQDAPGPLSQTAIQAAAAPEQAAASQTADAGGDVFALSAQRSGVAGRAVAVRGAKSASVDNPALPSGTKAGEDIPAGSSTAAPQAAQHTAAAGSTVLAAAPAAAMQTAAPPVGTERHAGGSNTGTAASAAMSDAPAGTLPHTMLSASPTTLEVGVAGGTHGWLKIRAELTSAGEVNASLTGSSAAAAGKLRGDLPALNSFLETQKVSVGTINVASTSHTTAAAAVSSAGAAAAAPEPGLSLTRAEGGMGTAVGPDGGGAGGRAHQQGQQGQQPFVPVDGDASGRPAGAEAPLGQIAVRGSYQNLTELGGSGLMSSVGYDTGGGRLNVRV